MASKNLTSILKVVEYNRKLGRCLPNSLQKVLDSNLCKSNVSGYHCSITKNKDFKDKGNQKTKNFGIKESGQDLIANASRDQTGKTDNSRDMIVIRAAETIKKTTIQKEQTGTGSTKSLGTFKTESPTKIINDSDDALKNDTSKNISKWRVLKKETEEENRVEKMMTRFRDTSKNMGKKARLSEIRTRPVGFQFNLSPSVVTSSDKKNKKGKESNISKEMGMNQGVSMDKKPPDTKKSENIPDSTPKRGQVNPPSLGAAGSKPGTIPSTSSQITSKHSDKTFSDQDMEPKKSDNKTSVEKTNSPRVSSNPPGNKNVKEENRTIVNVNYNLPRATAENTSNSKEDTVNKLLDSIAKAPEKFIQNRVDISGSEKKKEESIKQTVDLLATQSKKQLNQNLSPYQSKVANKLNSSEMRTQKLGADPKKEIDQNISNQPKLVETRDSSEKKIGVDLLKRKVDEIIPNQIETGDKTNIKDMGMNKSAVVKDSSKQNQGPKLVEKHDSSEKKIGVDLLKRKVDEIIPNRIETGDKTNIKDMGMNKSAVVKDSSKQNQGPKLVEKHDSSEKKIEKIGVDLLKRKVDDVIPNRFEVVDKNRTVKGKDKQVVMNDSLKENLRQNNPDPSKSERKSEPLESRKQSAYAVSDSIKQKSNQIHPDQLKTLSRSDSSGMDTRKVGSGSDLSKLKVVPIHPANSKTVEKSDSTGMESKREVAPKDAPKDALKDAPKDAHNYKTSDQSKLVVKSESSKIKMQDSGTKNNTLQSKAGRATSDQPKIIIESPGAVSKDKTATDPIKQRVDIKSKPILKLKYRLKATLKEGSLNKSENSKKQKTEPSKLQNVEEIKTVEKIKNVEATDEIKQSNKLKVEESKSIERLKTSASVVNNEQQLKHSKKRKNQDGIMQENKSLVNNKQELESVKNLEKQKAADKIMQDISTKLGKAEDLKVQNASDKNNLLNEKIVPFKNTAEKTTKIDHGLLNLVETAKLDKVSVSGTEISAIKNLQSIDTSQNQKSIAIMRDLKERGMMTFDNSYIISQLSRSRHALTFEQIPGPKLMKVCADIVNALPVIGTQTITRMMRSYNRLCISYGDKKLMSNRIRPLESLFNRYGDIVCLRVPFCEGIILVDKPELIHEVYKQRDISQILNSNFDSLNEVYKSLENNKIRMNANIDDQVTFVIDDFDIKRLFWSANRYHDSLDRISDLLVERIAFKRDNHNEVSGSFNKELKKWSLDCMMQVLFATEIGFLKAENTLPHLEIEMILNSLTEATEALRSCESGIQLWRVYPTPGFTQLTRSILDLERFLCKHIPLLKHDTKQENRMEMLQSSLESKQTASSLISGLILSGYADVDRLLKICVETMLIAVNSTSISLGFILYHLARYPEKQKILYKELLTVLPLKSSKLEVEHLEQLPFLNACVQESLRLKHPIPYSVMRLQRSIVLNKYYVPAGTWVMTANEVACKREENFQNADVFKPERWLGSSSQLYQDTITPLIEAQFEPFLGRDWLQKQLLIGTAKILRNFDVKYRYGEIESDGEFLSKPSKPFRFEFVERNI